MGRIRDKSDPLAYWRGTGCPCLDMIIEERRADEIRRSLRWEAKDEKSRRLKEKRSGVIYPEDMGGAVGRTRTSSTHL